MRGPCSVSVNSASLVLGMLGAGSGDFSVPRNARVPGQCFHIFLFISREVMMEFNFTHTQVCNKMPNPVRSYTNKPPFVLIASLTQKYCHSWEVSHCFMSVYQRSSARLFPSHFSAHRGRIPLSKPAATQGLSALAWQPTVCPIRGLALGERGSGWFLPQA